jgi:hypothetical protein
VDSQNKNLCNLCKSRRGATVSYRHSTELTHSSRWKRITLLSKRLISVISSRSSCLLHVGHGLSHKHDRFFFSVLDLSPHWKKSSLMSQAEFPLFPLPQQHTTASYGDILKTPSLSRDRVPLPGSGSSDNVFSFPGHLGSGSSISPDSSLFSSAPISLYNNASLTPSSSLSPGSPAIHAYTQLARQYQLSQEELKKVNQEYARLKYVYLFY